MAGFAPVDFGNALASGIGASSALRDSRRKADLYRREEESQKYIEPALAGDTGAFGKLAAANPQAASSVATMMGRLDEKKKAQLKEAVDYTTQAGIAILSASPEARAGAYQMARTDAQQRGMDISKWPTQWGPSTESWLKFNVDKARPYKDYFEQQQGQPQPIGPGGPSAAPTATPSAGGDPAAAIASIESGGKYDAVGPVADGKGSRAYGKYQIMDFNVGPWTQEVLGKPMSPQEFLANPQAQDAVFKAKFGQYQQKYGPEGAARAWFAGEGGMNNPGAKDVLGTSVADYGAKFTKAMGGPQPATGAPVQLAGGGAAPPIAGGQGDSMPGQAPGQMPLPPEVRGVQLPPGARMMGIKGVPVVKDGVVLIQKQDGSLDWVPLPQRKDPGQGAGMFPGNSVEANALNQMVARGILTEQQALDLAAGKAITDPSTGQIIWKRPSELVGGPPAAPAGPSTAPSAPTSGVPLTPPKAGANLSPGEKKVDEKFAAEYADFVASGGYADVQKQLGQLQEVATKLERGQGLTGPIVGNIPEGIRRVTNPSAVAAREAVEEVVQRNLRIVLGAQFTEKEGERLIQRSFNPALSESENAKRVRNLITQIQAAAQAKVDAARYYEENGTLKGWKGKMPSLSDFNPDGGGKSEPSASRGAPTGPADKGRLLFDARKAIEQGAPRDAVIQRLKEMGVEEQP